MTEAIAIDQVARLEGLTRGLSEHALRELINAFWRYCTTPAHAARVADQILATWTSDKYAPTPGDVRVMASNVAPQENVARPKGCKECDFCGLKLGWYLWTKGQDGERDTYEPLTPQRALEMQGERDWNFKTGSQGIYQCSRPCQCDLGRYLVRQAEIKKQNDLQEAAAKGKRR